MFNTILLMKAEKILTRQEWKKYEKGDAIWGDNAEPEELARWIIDNIDIAKRELNKHRCHYSRGIELYYITEYALVYCDCDESGEITCGFDYDLAEEIDLT